MKVRFKGGAASGSMECPRGESVEASSLAATQKNADILSQLGGKKKLRRKSRRNRGKSRRKGGKSLRKRGKRGSKKKRKSKR